MVRKDSKATHCAPCSRKYHSYESRKTHGMAGTPTYKSWWNMINRCTRPQDYPTYKGISHDPKWATFEGFFEDMRERKENEQLHRISNNGDYCKENCVWIDRIEHAKLCEWEVN